MKKNSYKHRKIKIVTVRLSIARLSGICGNRTGLLRGWEGAYNAPGKQYVISGTPG